MRTPLKLAGLAALAILTSMATSSILGQGLAQRRATTATPTNARVDAEPASATIVVPAPRPLTNLGNAFAEFRLRSLTLGVLARHVLVEAEADLRDERPGTTFVWWIRVLDAEDRSVVRIDRPYTHQPFTLPPTRVARPTFSESIPLLPGNYIVAVSLVDLPAGYDLAKLNDEASRPKHRCFSVGRPVTVN